MPYLEGLSTGELMALAEQCGLDIPAGFGRGSVIEELFYQDYDAGMDHAQYPDGFRGEFRELVVLPQLYHITFIEVLIRDPLWAFVFWEIKEDDRELPEDIADNEGYCLRVIPLDESSLRPVTAASFIVAIDVDDYGRYLGFPPDDGRCFKVELCMQNGEQITVLAESRPFILPRLIAPKTSGESRAAHNALAQISGIDSFSLVHSEDRLLRAREIKRQ